MILIAHRGNTHGRVIERENTPAFVDEALAGGFDVEVDVWWVDGNFFLGHDRGETQTTIEYLSRPGLWLHAKNIAALYELRRAGLHCFFHDSDDATLTSQGYIWTYPGKTLTSLSICVLPERVDGVRDDLTRCAGVCSDFISRYR